MSEFTGVYKAVVFDTADPMSKGRVRLLVPAILGNTPTGWADPMGNGVAKANDVVWAFFENGDLNRAIYVASGTGAGGGRAVGEVSVWSGLTAPTGAFLCQGQAVSRVLYAPLFAVLSTRYGTGDGSTTFNLPNLKGKTPFGQDTSDTLFDEVGESGGSKTTTLVAANLPQHTHTSTFSRQQSGEDDLNYTSDVSGGDRGSLAALNKVSNTGDGLTNPPASFSRLPPYQVMNFIIWHTPPTIQPAIVDPVNLSTARVVREWTGSAYPARAGAVRVEWVGPVKPTFSSTQAQPGDTWIYSA